MPGSTTWRARRSASIMGRLYGALERREDTLDLPVAMPPVRPIMSIFLKNKIMAMILLGASC